MATRAGVVAAVDTEEADVRALLTKVEAGELDAGVVYVTDAGAGRSRVETVAIPDAVNVVATLPIAVLAGARRVEVAGRFVAFVTGSPGAAILRRHGFEAGAP